MGFEGYQKQEDVHSRCLPGPSPYDRWGVRRNCKGPTLILIPSKGWSSLDQEGMALYDPEADRAFVKELKIHLNPKIPLIELNLHLNTREFAQEAVDRFIQLYKENKKRK
jgi:uncharacterized protein (UPF0261 family)